MRRLKPIWLILILVAVILVYLPGFSKYLRLRHKEVELERQIDRLKSQITDLQKEEHLLKTDLVKLEQAVREELGLVKPGEIVLKVVEEEPAPEKKVEPQPKSK